MNELVDTIYHVFLVAYYVFALGSLFLGVRLLHVIFQSDLVTPEGALRMRGRYVLSLFLLWVLNIARGLAGPVSSRLPLYYYFVLLFPVIFSWWDYAVAKNKRAGEGAEIFMVFLSVITLLGGILLSFYG